MNHYAQAVPATNNGPAWLAVFTGVLMVAYGNKLGQQVGLAVIGAGVSKLVS